MRLGIFGGTFDPPHSGHIELALFTLNEKNLDKIIFVPAYHAPYPDKSASTSFEHRFSMTELAIRRYPQFEVSNVEGERGGDSYTIQTIRHFREAYRLSQKEIFLIIGADSFKRFGEWEKPESILEESSVCVLKRSGVELEEFDPNYINSVELLHNDLIDISSHELRERIAEGADVTEYLDDGVIEYIYQNRLYGGG